MSNIIEQQNELLLCNINKQRQKFFLLNRPPTRYEPNTPYPQYTKMQLDMRRKAEILQYKKNSSQTSQLTKSQKFSMLVNANSYINKKSQCVEDMTKPQWTTSCDVPGQPILLYYDPTIPLYNYQTKQNPYAFENDVQDILQDNLVNGLILSLFNVSIYYQGGVNGLLPFNTQDTNFMSLCIHNVISNNYIYNFGIPLGVYISGYNPNNFPVTANFYLNKIILNIYYYPNTTSYYVTDTTNNNFLVNKHNISITTDISGSFTVNSLSNFNGNQYIANVDISKILLPSQYGDVYNFNFTCNMSINITSATTNSGGVISGFLANFKSGIYINSPLVTTNNNCSFVAQPNTVLQNYQNYYFNGISS